MEPKGCWNCLNAVIDGERPEKWVPGLKYRASCNAPERGYISPTCDITMIEERPELPICERHLALKEG